MGVSRPTNDLAVRIGQVLLGKYRVDGILGQGGMGVVAECTHLHLNDRYAIKMLRPDVLQDDEARSRFMREAQAAVKLKSEYVAKVSDVGTLESGTPYMVMEFLEGVDLGRLLDERGHLPIAWAAELVLQAAEALAEAHSIGIVHRDIKPANLFVTWRPDGTSLVKVLDFGISKSPMGTDMHLTQTQSLLGTPAYMSPEQMRSARLVDARTDMWSLGTVLYELLEGRKPFEAESFSEMCVKVAVDPPAPMTNVPPELEAVIMRCLSKAPEQRYASMAELGRDLAPFSQDPQQGLVMVERMHRMLRRGEAALQAAGGWEGGTTGSGMRATPYPVRDAASAPIRSASPFDVASNPAMRAFHPGMDRTPIPQAAPRERSAPALAITEAQIVTAPIAIPSSSGSKTFAIVLAAIGAIALAGLVFALVGSGPRASSTPNPVAAEPPPVVAPVKADVKQEPPTPPPTVVDSVPVVAPPTKTDVKTDVKADVKTDVKTSVKSNANKTTNKGTPNVGKKVVVKPPEEKPPVEVKPDPPKGVPCDVYDNAHGCGKKK